MDRMHGQIMGYCASVIRVSLKVSLLKPSGKIRAYPHLRGPFSSKTYIIPTGALLEEISDLHSFLIPSQSDVDKI